jgi:hypothetical protein
VSNGWLSIKFSCSPATVQLHNECAPNKEESENLYYKRISANNSGTATNRVSSAKDAIQGNFKRIFIITLQTCTIRHKYE